jgi:hypothetical protein
MLSTLGQTSRLSEGDHAGSHFCVWDRRSQCNALRDTPLPFGPEHTCAQMHELERPDV